MESRQVHQVQRGVRREPVAHLGILAHTRRDVRIRIVGHSVLELLGKAHIGFKSLAAHQPPHSRRRQKL